jgi:hypothetical protein
LVNLTLCMTKLRVLVLSFPDFMDISIEHLLLCRQCFFYEPIDKLVFHVENFLQAFMVKL